MPKFRERKDGVVRDQRIGLRVSDKEKRWLTKQANKRGITVSNFILMKALKAFKGRV
jgi:uncharacterized protein (DUF1778 family)